ncbi:type I pantothenate kinase [Aerococcaceae bacterium DSM 111020]|nr:type I pantothenate kinase [Aerococcaceae bacterium DSM 111020]
MIQDEIFIQFTRKQWSELFHKQHDLIKVDDLDELVSLNDRLTNADVREIYRPLLQFIDIFYENKLALRKERQEFLKLDRKVSQPFVIGISGSVAVGKSTVARVLQELLGKVYPNKEIALLTTDGFLFPNKELEKRGILHRKGFPDSYDMPSFLSFMTKVKTGAERIEYPIYSHHIYDIVPDEVGVLHKPDILIMEGINVFQLPENQQLYVSNFFDFSIFVDADTMDIKKWYMERYYMLVELAKDNPDNYFHKMSKWSDEKKEAYANEVWYTINLTNLVQHIAPTKERAQVVLHKSENHLIDLISVRKY